MRIGLSTTCPSSHRAGRCALLTSTPQARLSSFPLITSIGYGLETDETTWGWGRMSSTDGRRALFDYASGSVESNRGLMQTNSPAAIPSVNPTMPFSENFDNDDVESTMLFGESPHGRRSFQYTERNALDKDSVSPRCRTGRCLFVPRCSLVHETATHSFPLSLASWAIAQ